nr:hypothetical protein [Microbacterium lemovicicum]
MAAAKIYETVSQDWVRCSAEEFGSFVDYLAELTYVPRDEEIKVLDAEQTAERADLATKALSNPEDEWRARELERSIERADAKRKLIEAYYEPSWSVTRRSGRVISAMGSWASVRELVDIDNARNVEVELGSSSSQPRVRVFVGTRQALRVQLTAPSEGWLESNLPVVRARMRDMRPRWGLVSKTVGALVVTITSFAVLLTGLAAVLLGSSGWVPTMYAAFLPIAAVGWVFLAQPYARFGTLPPRWWARSLKWVVLVILAAVLGGVVTKVLGL